MATSLLSHSGCIVASLSHIMAFILSAVLGIVIFAVYITVTLLKKGRKQKKKFY